MIAKKSENILHYILKYIRESKCYEAINLLKRIL